MGPSPPGPALISCIYVPFIAFALGDGAPCDEQGSSSRPGRCCRKLRSPGRSPAGRGLRRGTPTCAQGSGQVRPRMAVPSAGPEAARARGPGGGWPWPWAGGPPGGVGGPARRPGVSRWWEGREGPRGWPAWPQASGSQWGQGLSQRRDPRGGEQWPAGRGTRAHRLPPHRRRLGRSRGTTVC